MMIRRSAMRLFHFETVAGLQNIEEALRRTPQDVLDARIQRHKRAMDISLKHTALPKEMQEQQTPFEYYLQVCCTDPSRATFCVQAR